MNKDYSVLKFNLDVFATSAKFAYNDEVVDVTQAQQVLKKFMLSNQNDTTIRKTKGSQ